MKIKLLAALALFLLITAFSSCSQHQYPASYHHGNNGQSRYY